MITSTMKRLALVFILVSAFPAWSQEAAIGQTSITPSTAAVYLQGNTIAGEALASGQAVCVDSTATTASGNTQVIIKRAGANSAGDLARPVGLVVNTSVAGVPCKVVTRDPSLTVTGGTPLSIGDIVILHTTLGALCIVDTSIPQPTAGWYVSVFGVSTATGKLNFGGTQYTSNWLGIIRSEAAKP